MEHVKYVIGQELIEVFEKVLKTENRSIAREMGMNLSMAEIHTIAAIGIERLQKMSEIAGQLHITMGTLTVMVGNLVKKGLVERYKSEADKRIVMIGLTKSGKRIFRAHEKYHENLVDALLAGLDDKEKKIVSKALDNLQSFIVEC